MPDSHFTGSFKGHGDYDAMQDAWTAFISGGVSGVTFTGSTLLQVNAVSAPSATGSQGYDCTIAIPYFIRQTDVVYTLKYTDDSGATFSDVGYDFDPDGSVNFPNGYQPGRQFSVFADGQPGALSTSLP